MWIVFLKAFNHQGFSIQNGTVSYEKKKCHLSPETRKKSNPSHQMSEISVKYADE